MVIKWVSTTLYQINSSVGLKLVLLSLINELLLQKHFGKLNPKFLI